MPASDKPSNVSGAVRYRAPGCRQLARSSSPHAPSHTSLPRQWRPLSGARSRLGHSRKTSHSYPQSSCNQVTSWPSWLEPHSAARQDCCCTDHLLPTLIITGPLHSPTAGESEPDQFIPTPGSWIKLPRSHCAPVYATPVRPPSLTIRHPPTAILRPGDKGKKATSEILFFW